MGLFTFLVAVMVVVMVAVYWRLRVTSEHERTRKRTRANLHTVRNDLPMEQRTQEQQRPQHHPRD